MSMRSHVSKIIAACFAIVHQLGSIRRSVPCFILQSLVSSLVLQWLDYGNPSHLTNSMQPVLNSAARLVFSAFRYDRIMPLTQLHWLKVPEFKLAVLVYRCLHQTAPTYLAEEFHQSSADEARHVSALL